MNQMKICKFFQILRITNIQIANLNLSSNEINE